MKKLLTLLLPLLLSIKQHLYQWINYVLLLFKVKQVQEEFKPKLSAKEMSVSSIITTSVTGCSRCGNNHQNITFAKFTNPVKDTGSQIWTHWTICPVLNEPILLYAFDD